MQKRHLGLWALLTLIGPATGCGDSAQPTPDSGTAPDAAVPDANVPDDASDAAMAEDASDAAPVEDASDAAADTGVEGECPGVLETGTRTYTIRMLTLPASADDEPLPAVGFNVDGLTSQADSVAGCLRADLAGGIDNGFAVMFDGLSNLLTMAGIDVLARLQAAVTDGDIAVEVVLGEWNGTSDDACVTVAIRDTTGGDDIAPLVTTAPLSGSVISGLVFEGSLTFAPTFSVDAEGGPCTPASQDCVTMALPIVMQRVLARLQFAPDMMTLDSSASPTATNSSMLGGHVRYVGDDEAAFRVGLIALMEAYAPGLGGALDMIARNFMDLDSTPVLSACTAVGNGTSADTFSAGFLISSVAPD